MVEKAFSLCVLSAHTYMVLMHGKITPGLMDYIASELVPVSHSAQSLSLLVMVGKWLYCRLYIHIYGQLYVLRPGMQTITCDSTEHRKADSTKLKRKKRYFLSHAHSFGFIQSGFEIYEISDSALIKWRCIKFCLWCSQSRKIAFEKNETETSLSRNNIPGTLDHLQNIFVHTQIHVDYK